VRSAELRSSAKFASVTSRTSKLQCRSPDEEENSMPKVTYVEFNGTEHTVDVPIGLSVMRGAIDNSLPGIDADCGGACACATCHVYVEHPWRDKLAGSQERETEMLGFTAGAEDSSRLACQIPVTAELDGLIVRMPESQH
jgi:ferredoxin, 2Fe-2S